MLLPGGEGGPSPAWCRPAGARPASRRMSGFPAQVPVEVVFQSLLQTGIGLTAPLPGLVQGRRRKVRPACTAPPESIRAGVSIHILQCMCGAGQVHLQVQVQLLVHVQVPGLPLWPSPRGPSRGE